MPPRFRRFARMVLSLLIAALLLPAPLLGTVPTARSAAILTVTTLADDTATNGNCSLREAVQAANSRAAVDGCDPAGIARSAPVPIALAAGVYQVGATLAITGNLTIAGAGVSQTTIQKTTAGSVLSNQGTATLNALAITAGNAVGGKGGGIENRGTLTLDAVRVTGNRADLGGGGIYNTGAATLTIRRSTIDNNQAGEFGGGIASTSRGSTVKLVVTQSAIVRNTAGPNGGTTFSAKAYGGELFTAGNSEASITNSTISDNLAGDQGAGLYNDHSDSSQTSECDKQGRNGCGTPGAANLITLQNVTISHNTAAGQAGGVFNFGTLRLGDSIVAHNAAAQANADCLTRSGSALDSRGYNLIQTPSPSKDCTVIGTSTGNVYGQDPLLGSLRDNGGPTLTRALGSASPALNAGSPTNALTIDQRGSLRPVNGRADIGAYESGGAINDTWVTALNVDATTAPTITQTVDRVGQSRWYKFKVSPQSKIVVQLTNLPANYDLTLFKDIANAFNQVSSTQDLLHLGAEFADDAFNPDTFSPDTFSPDTFSPDTFSPDTFSPDTFSPDTFSPDTFSPDTFSPDTFSPDTFSPDTFSPDTFSPDTFSSAQTRSLLAVSAFNGLAGEGIRANTWLNDGDYYVRVRGRNGVFDATNPFRLQIMLSPGSCTDPSLQPGSASSTAVAGNFQTLILTDTGRFADGSDADRSAMLSTLQTFAARPEIAGKVVDLAGDAGIAALNARADQAVDCPYAKNLVAGAIKDLVDSYRDSNPNLAYVVMLGNDDVIPFFRHPDQSLIGNERDFVPPVLDSSASQASLRTGYYLSQDRYGADTEISLRSGTLPLPNLAHGRLVETFAEITAQINLYLSTNGAALQPQSSAVSAYDFLEDAGNAVASEFQAGTGQAPNALIAPRNISPLDPRSWTADDLRDLVLGSRHDLIFLAGHFSANSALAADFSTRMLAAELADSSVDLANTLIISAGCHAGYNLVDDHAVPGVTQSPDWAQAAARKRALLIAGTGYQYGDTDFIEYSERLYRAFSQQLRAGTGALSVGQVLVSAKKQYLQEVPSITGLHEKALLEATLFGLPMVKVNMPAGRGAQPASASIVSSTNPYTSGPGAGLGLQRADVSISTPSSLQNVTLQSLSGGDVTASYLVGPQGVVTNPAQPVLPLSVSNVSVPNTVMRGVGFRGGTYSDLANILPLTGAPTTEVRGVKVPFYSDIYFPVQPFGANVLGALSGSGGTQLMLTPAQYRSATPGSLTGTLRKFNGMDFRLFYNDNVSQAALAAAPMIVSVADFISDGKLHVTVSTYSSPATGVQEAWITYSGDSGPFAGRWQSLDLTRDALNPDVWRGTLDLQGVPSAGVRYLIQAASGTGLVSMLTNQGAYYTAGLAAGTPSGPQQPTSLVIQSPAPNSSAPFRGDVPVTALLRDGNGNPLANQAVTLSIGNQSRRVATGPNGVASAQIRLLGLPGDYTLQASFAGAAAHAPSTASQAFTVTKRNTVLTLDAQPIDSGGTASVIATLTDDLGKPLGLKTIFLTASNGRTGTVAVITDFAGRANASYLNVTAPFTVTATFASGQANQPADERYNAAPPVSDEVELTRLPSVTTITASDVPYDGLPHGATASTTGQGDVELGPTTIAYFVRGSTTALPGAPTDAGLYTATATFGGDATYAPSSASADFAILQVASVTTVTAANAVFDGQPHGATAVATGAGGLNQSLTVTYTGRNGTTYPASTTPPTALGDYLASASYPGDTNHTGSQGSATFSIVPAGSTLTITSPAALGKNAQGQVSVSATLLSTGGTPLANKTIVFSAGSATASGTTDGSGVASATLQLVSGQYTLTAVFSGDSSYSGSQATQTVIVYQSTQFVIWGGNPGGVAVGQTYQFWGPQWNNQVVSGTYEAGDSFKGYADRLSSNGLSWTTGGGGSGSPPATVEQYISVLVSSNITKRGNNVSGNVIEIVVLRVNSPELYRPDTGVRATGELVTRLP